MSYEDKSVSELVAATAVNTPKYSNNYFYDGTSGLGSIRMYAENSCPRFSCQCRKRKSGIAWRGDS